MPTINITNRICSHCGGTMWYTYVDRKKGSVYSCPIAKKESNKKWMYKNPDKIKAKNKRSKDKVKDTIEYKRKNLERAIAYNKKYPEKSKTHIKKWMVKNKESLGDYYIKILICRSEKSFKINSIDIPQELVELKRKEQQLKKQLKNQTNGK